MEERPSSKEIIEIEPEHKPAPRTGFLSALIGSRRERAIDDPRLNKVIDALHQHYQSEEDQLKLRLQRDYTLWADTYRRIRREFDDAYDFFMDLERDLPGWYCVSPNLALARSVAVCKGGYTFAACIMKNHHRDAPLSEKSLTISLGLEETPPGVGDERPLGRTGKVDAELWGVENCSGKSLREQADAAAYLASKIQNRSILFRMNHKAIGQQCTRLPLSILEQHSLKDLCKGLFVLLNNDVLSGLRESIAGPEQLLLASTSAPAL